MADWRTRHRSARAEFDVLLQYNGSSHTGQDAMAADQQDKELALDIAKLLCCLLESRNFKVFLPYRDTMPGMCKFDAMQESLQNCKVVVVVFTPGFRLCHWEEYKQKYAFADFLEERRSWRLIPVCVGHPSRTLPDCLRHHGVAELTENCESDSTQLEILLDSVAEAVHKISSPPVPSNLDQSNQASLTSSSSPCAPTYIRDVTSLVAKAFPEICSPETKPVSSQSSSTQLKQPVTPTTEPMERGTILSLSAKAFTGVRRIYSRLTSRVENAETEAEAEEEAGTETEAAVDAETPSVASWMLSTFVCDMALTLLSPTIPPFYRSSSLPPELY